MPDEEGGIEPEDAGQSMATDNELFELKSGVVPVVAIGASAGGIEALGQFFDAMPPNSGLTFLVVLHLDPTKESQLASVLRQHTTMSVVEIEDGMEVAPNYVYAIAPNFDLILDRATLKLIEPQLPRGRRHPIDVLFTSLASQRQQRSAAVILSGTGTNGTQGLREIKAAGGLTLIQDPMTAQFDGMARSAINAGHADHVLPPQDMPGPLLRYFHHSYAVTEADAPAADDGQQIERILKLVRAQSGLDFRSYKPSTLIRRIKRRMSLKDMEEIDEYLDLLRDQPDEVRTLVSDLLITVTSFFRDADAWAILDERVIMQMVADRETGAVIRVWVPACATGEEAYSVAMLFIERAEAAHKRFDLKIFASDILDSNLNVARAGVFPGSSVELLPTSRMQRFFEKLGGSYQVTKGIRDLLVFARHDLLHTPPFSRMDLITCRNMLIYVEPEAQRRIMALFHFALSDGGRLFLGSAETLGRHDDLFETVSKKWRIYRRVGRTRHDIVDFPSLGRSATRNGTNELLPLDTPVRVTELARRALLDRYAPASVLIDQKGRVLYYHGATGDYLQQPTGEPTRDLLAMAREGLLAKLRVALHEAIVEGHDTGFNAYVIQGVTLRPVLVSLFRLPASHHASGLVVVTFEPEPEPREIVAAPRPEGDDRPAPSTTLEDELRSTRAELQSTIEQLESVNEELKASNEEATSMNEELQSTNEELETSKEELQSYNEELHTINNQLQHKIKELQESGDDLTNLLSGTGVATLFLDTRYLIKWFSPATEQLLDLLSSDIGRPISHFARKFSDASFMSDAEMVLAKLTPIEAEIQSDDERWFLRRLLPYRTQDNRIAGLVITFTDITDRKRATRAIDEARIYAEAIVATARQSLVVLDAQLRIRSANQAFYALIDADSEGIAERQFYELGNGNWDVPELRRLLERVLVENEPLQNVEIALGPLGLSQRMMLVNARKLLRNGGRENLILLAVEEITGRKRDAEHQEMLIGELNHRVKNVLATVQAVITQTLRQTTSLDVFKTAFMGRLQALAQAHDILVNNAWLGTEIGDLVLQALAPYRADEKTRILAEGPALTVRPQTGIALVMILHELATNAAKYGALSVPTGKLAITWFRHGAGSAERIHVQWCETDGPTVTGPSRQGFGTKLIQRSTAHELGGEARLEYRAEGLRCELIFPPTDDQATGDSED